MTIELTKQYADKKLGTPILVNNEGGIMSYEHNTGRLALYSKGEKLIRFLQKGDKIRFSDGIERVVFSDIKE